MHDPTHYEKIAYKIFRAVLSQRLILIIIQNSLFIFVSSVIHSNNGSQEVVHVLEFGISSAPSHSVSLQWDQVLQNDCCPRCPLSSLKKWLESEQHVNKRTENCFETILNLSPCCQDKWCGESWFKIKKKTTLCVVVHFLK